VSEEYNHDAEPQGLATEAGEGFSFNMGAETASSGYPLLPANTYDATVEACEFKISKNSGNPMWQVKWAIPYTNEKGAEKVSKITSFVVFSAEQRGRAKMFLKRVAPELAELEDFNPKLLADQITGKRARVKINHQKGQDDELRANVADVLAPTAGGGSFSL
jgi:hypothetical protein